MSNTSTNDDHRRTALVTGGAIRVGRLIATGLAASGFDILLHYNSSAGEADAVRVLIEQGGGRCETIQADLNSAEGVEQLAEAVRRRHERLDVLVNSAARLQHGSVLDADAAQWDDALGLNARAPHLLTRALAPLLAAANGCVVNILDRSAFTLWVSYGVYSASRAALVQVTRLHARALAPAVRVNALVLGDVYPPNDPSRAGAWRGNDTPLGHSVLEADVVRAVDFMVGARSLTGSVVVLDSGAGLTTT